MRLKRNGFLLVLPLLGLTGFALKQPEVSQKVETVRDPAPHEVVLLAGGSLALVTERGTDSVALLNLASGMVLAHAFVGDEPFCVAASANIAVVTNYGSDSLSVLTISGDKLTVAATIAVGDEPRGVALSRDGKTAYVALAGEDAVAVVDLATRKILKRLPTGLEPWHVALTPDGKRLTVGCTRARTLSVYALPSGEELYTVPLNGRNVRHIGISADGKQAFVPFINERRFPATKDNIDRGWVVGNRLARVPLTEDGPREAIALDTQGDALGDVDGCTISPDGQTVALTAGGTHELVLFSKIEGLPFVAFGGPEDYLEPESVQRIRRIKLGGRPLGAQFSADGKQLIVANDFLNAVQVVDVALGKVTKTITLGGPKAPSQVRQGEQLFHDAKRSFHSWYSCASCHTEGHTNGGNFDTFNDGSYGKPKKTLSLRGVVQTSPYTWHGWQKTLRQGVVESFTKSMQGEEPTTSEIEAVEAYLKSLDWKKSPFPTNAAGLKVFVTKGCVSCHGGTNYATPTVTKAGLEETGDAYEGYNPPTLRNVYSRAPYLHDGRARTLEDVLTKHHRPSQLTGQPDCTPQELKDLVAFLKSL
ncbi:c-type cytochrome [Armatimonas sp.]|uniref:c-type cytochrome n=1 Tax=Armatimonas sp. TaxID=1872638 RepID=UPI00286BBF2D|nr:c-type cytochrome [Armatimonas sp.]